MANPIDIVELRGNYIYLPSGALAINGYKPKRVGYQINTGYEMIRFKGKIFPAHRLIWAFHFYDPKDKEIDHIDGDKLNNKIENLRAVTPSENRQNMPAFSSSKSGIKGVYWEAASRRWVATLKSAGGVSIKKRCHTKEEAISARMELEAIYHPFAKQT